MALTVISVNVNGLRDEHRRLGFLQWLSHLSASVVCLQETLTKIPIVYVSLYVDIYFACRYYFHSQKNSYYLCFLHINI